MSYEDRVAVSSFVGAANCCLDDHPCLESNSEALITFFVTFDADALTRTIFRVPSFGYTPCGNESESLPLFSLLYATLGDDDDDDDSDEDFDWTILREDVVCIMVCCDWSFWSDFFFLAFEINLECFVVSTVVILSTVIITVVLDQQGIGEQSRDRLLMHGQG